MCSRCASPFPLPTVLRKCDCRLRSMLETLGQNVGIMSCSGGGGGMYGNVVDMKGERSLAGATAAVCWRRFQNKNPKPRHMFSAVPRDFITHPGPTGMDMIFFFFISLPSSFLLPPLHSVKCRIVYSTSQRRAGAFSISIYVSGLAARAGDFRER